MNLTTEERSLIGELGRDVAEVEQQLLLLKGGGAKVALNRPCVVGDGIVQLNSVDDDDLLGLWKDGAVQGRLSGFVPASGAATRFMAALVSQREQGPLSLANLRARAVNEKDAAVALAALDHIAEFALWQTLQKEMSKRGLSADPPTEDSDLQPLLSALLDDDGMKASSLPKALLPFHRVGDAALSATVEHLLEASELLMDGNGTVRQHFTVSQEHRYAIKKECARFVESSQIEGGFDLSFSIQSHKTDTVALDGDRIARNEVGDILFRPGGHGSLLRNLSRVDGDVVLIKNIDNIVPARARTKVVDWRKKLVGTLLSAERKVHDLLRRLDAGESPVAEAVALLDGTFGWDFDNKAEADPEALRRQIYWALWRPMRVAGMVANDGQPGGGPFWVRGAGPQIVESVQVEHTDPEQAKVFSASTHFNPVDLVCSLRDHTSTPYQLHRFINRRAVIVNDKAYKGQNLKVLEHPGLWNGSMASWNTIFVEIPRDLFQPVKVLADLNSSGHRSE